MSDWMSHGKASRDEEDVQTRGVVGFVYRFDVIVRTPVTDTTLRHCLTAHFLERYVCLGGPGRE